MHAHAEQLQQLHITILGFRFQYLAAVRCTKHIIKCARTTCNRQSHTHLALLVAVGQQLQAVCGDGQELGVALFQQGDHPLQAVSQAHSHLSSLLVQKQVVERGDGIKEHRLHGGAEEEKHVCLEGITKKMTSPLFPGKFHDWVCPLLNF